jgi:hypothetical protein
MTFIPGKIYKHKKWNDVGFMFSTFNGKKMCGIWFNIHSDKLTNKRIGSHIIGCNGEVYYDEFVPDKNHDNWEEIG